MAQDPSFPNISNEKAYTIIRYTVDKYSGQYKVRAMSTVPTSEAIRWAKEIKNDAEKVLENLFIEGKINSALYDELQQILELTQRIKDPAEFRLVILGKKCPPVNYWEPPERTMLLIGINISVMSKLYWTQQLKSPELPWHMILRSNGFNEDNLFKINWTDVIGGVIGCALCSGGGISGCIGCAANLGSLASKIHVKE